MTDDILSDIYNDPKKLLEVLKQMDSNGDKHIVVQELIEWVKKNAGDIKFLKENTELGTQEVVSLAEEFKKYGESALAYDALEKQRANPNGPAMTQEFMKKWNEARVNHERLTGELQAVTQEFQSALAIGQEMLEAQNRKPTAEELEDEKDFQDDIKERRSGAQRLRKTGVAESIKMAEAIEKSIAEDLKEHLKEQAEKGIVQESPEVKGIRTQAGKYQVDDAGEVDLGQLTGVVQAVGGTAPNKTQGRQ